MPKKNPFWLESWCELRRQAVHVFRFIGHHFHHFRWQFAAYRYILVNSNTNNIKPQPIASRISFFSIRWFFVRGAVSFLHFLLSDYIVEEEFLLLLGAYTHRARAPSEMASPKVREVMFFCVRWRNDRTSKRLQHSHQTVGKPYYFYSWKLYANYDFSFLTPNLFRSFFFWLYFCRARRETKI